MASQPGPSSMSIQRKYVIVGVAILAIAIAAGFLTQPSERSTFDVAWSTESHDLGARSAAIPRDGGTAEVAWTVDRLNVTRAHVNVTVESTANHTGQDDITVEVADPTGNASSGTGAFSGAGPATLPVRHVVVDLPTVETVEALNETDARSILAIGQTSRDGRGTWTIVVEVAHAGPETDHRVEVALQVTTYHPEISPQD